MRRAARIATLVSAGSAAIFAGLLGLHGAGYEPQIRHDCVVPAFIILGVSVAAFLASLAIWRWPLRFSLRTLVTAQLFAAACVGAWYRSDPWVPHTVLADVGTGLHFVGFSEDGSGLVTVSWIFGGIGYGELRNAEDARSRGKVEIWDCASWRRVRTVEIEMGQRGRWARLSADGRKLTLGPKWHQVRRGAKGVVTKVDGPAEVIDVGSGGQLCELGGEEPEFQPRAVLAADRARAIVVSRSSGIYDLRGSGVYWQHAMVLDASTGNLIARVDPGRWQAPCPTAVSPCGERLAFFEPVDGITYRCHIWRRRRPEWWWGVAWLWEFWLAAAVGAALAWSVVRDRRSLGAGSGLVSPDRAG